MGSVLFNGVSAPWFSTYRSASSGSLCGSFEDIPEAEVSLRRDPDGKLRILGILL